MESIRKSFIFYRDWYEAVRGLDAGVRCEVYDAIMEEVFSGSCSSLSGVAEIAMRFIRPQIARDSARWEEIKEKRAASGRLGGIAKQMVANSSKCQQVLANASKRKQKVANQAVNVNVNVNDNVNVNVNDNVSNDNNILHISAIEKTNEEVCKSVEVEGEDAFVDRMYALYPSKCPVRGVSLGKTHKDKVRIRALMRRYTREDIERVMRMEVDNKLGRYSMKNFTTFLNNFPDPQAVAQNTTPRGGYASSASMLPTGMLITETAEERNKKYMDGEGW